MSLDQHTPFDVDLVDSTAPLLPRWMAAEEPGPDWAFRRSGEFPTLPDPALKSGTEEENADVR